MANSFLRDLYELSHGQVVERYGFKKLSRADFMLMRAAAGGASINRIIVAGQESFVGQLQSSFIVGSNIEAAGQCIVTRMFIAVTGSNDAIVNVECFDSDDASIFGSIQLSPSALANLDLSGLEADFYTFSFEQTDVDATGKFHYILFGYVPSQT